MEKNKNESKQIYTCPSLQECNWLGTKEELCLHMQTFHCVSFTDQNYFKLYAPNTVSYQRNIVLKYYKRMFLLQFKSDMQSETFWCSVSCIGRNEDSKDFFYCVSFLNKNNGKRMYKYGEIQLKTNWNFNVNSMRELYLNAVKSKTKNFEIIFYIHRYKKSSVMRINNKVLRNQLKCVVCSNTDIIKKPIFLCLVGHVICNGCKVKPNKTERLYKCDYGRCGFRSQQITNNLQNFCSNREFGCYFIGSKQKVRCHKLVCLKNTIKTCFATDCKWRGRNMDFWEHLSQEHSDSTTTNYKILHYDFDQNHCGFTTFMVCNQEVFKISCQAKYRYPSVMKWTCHWVNWGKNKNRQCYKLVLRFISSSEPNHLRNELELIQYQNKRKKIFQVPLALLKPYLNGNSIKFSYSILETPVLRACEFRLCGFRS